jgi:transcriptional regulator with XRE-family HTH domain
LSDTVETASNFELTALGARIRQLRTVKKLSLAELSLASKVSVGMLSHIERGQSMPSLTTLNRVSEALGVDLADLFGREKKESEDRLVVRHNDRLRVEFGPPGLSKELLSPVRASDLEMLVLVLQPGTHSGDEPWFRNGEKAGLVLSGRFELTVGSTVLELEAGDSFQFDASIPHRFRNLANQETRVMWIIRCDGAA